MARRKNRPTYPAKPTPGGFDDIDMGQFERELAALTREIEGYILMHPGASVAEVMGEYDLGQEEVLLAAAYHQRKHDAVQRYIAMRRAEKVKGAQ